MFLATLKSLTQGFSDVDDAEIECLILTPREIEIKKKRYVTLDFLLIWDFQNWLIEEEKGKHDHGLAILSCGLK